MAIINNNSYLNGINFHSASAVQRNNEEKLRKLYSEKAKYENQAYAWDDITVALKDLRFATISLESVTAESLKSTLTAFVDAYNEFRHIRDHHAHGALRGSSMLNAIENQLQRGVIRLRDLDIGITLVKGKLLINNAELDNAVENNAESIVNFLKVDSTTESFKSTMYRALDNALRPAQSGMIEGMIAGAMLTIKNQLMHLDRNIQITENLLAARQKIAGNNQTHHTI